MNTNTNTTRATLGDVFDDASDIYVLARQLVDAALDASGGTVNLDGLVPTGFYLVGGEHPGIVTHPGDGSHSSRTELACDVAEWISALPGSVRALGSWLDNGMVYFDAVTLVSSRGDAARLAGERGEIAFGIISHNLREFTEFRINAAGEYLTAYEEFSGSDAGEIFN